MNTLEGKVVIVTGGGQGLGSTTCMVLANDGANVIPVDVKEEEVKKVEKEIIKNGGNAKSYLLDVTNAQQISKVIETVFNEFGRIDILINNAGIDYTKSIDEISMEEFTRVINVNLIGQFFMTKAVWGYMKKQQKGHIVNIASTAAKRAWPNTSAYHASKWGVLGLSHALHTEGRQHNIKVTAVVPGGMRTPFLLDRFPDIPLDILQDPKNVAETILFVLKQPAETVIPEVMVLPAKETSWP